MNFPQEFTNRMTEMLKEESEGFMEAINREAPYRALRRNPLKCEAASLHALLGDAPTQVPWESDGYYYDESTPAGKHPFHEAGMYYIQEPSAMAPVTYLDPQPGERILDLCAAPGGKSTQIAGRLLGQGLLISNEIHPTRSKILAENVERLGIANAIVTNETPDSLAARFVGYFDRILVDAPCSGEGMFRKNENASTEWSPENVALCADRQDDILESADAMLRPGGRLVYSTCTFAPDEDEGSIYRFMQNHPAYHLLQVELFEGMQPGSDQYLQYCVKPVGNISSTIGKQLNRTIRLWPHHVKGEGHFIAVLQKGEDNDGEYRPLSRGGLQKGLNSKGILPFLDFAEGHLTKDTIRRLQNGVFIRFGDNLYVLPKDAPSLNGLKIARPGLQLGTYLKNRFEPAHALAMHLHPTESVNRVIFPSSSREATAYIAGESLRISEDSPFLTINNPKSPWILCCVDDASIGYAKYAGGVLKNHYPKGLRKC